MPRSLAPPVAYTVSIRDLQRVLRETQKDERIPDDKLKRLRECINEVTVILSEAQAK